MNYDSSSNHSQTCKHLGGNPSCPGQTSAGTRCLAMTSLQRYRNCCGELLTTAFPQSNASPTSLRTSTQMNVTCVRDSLRTLPTCLKNADRCPGSGSNWNPSAKT